MRMEAQFLVWQIARVLLGCYLLADLEGKVLEIVRRRRVGRGALGNIFQDIGHFLLRLVIILTRQMSIGLIATIYEKRLFLEILFNFFDGEMVGSLEGPNSYT